MPVFLKQSTAVNVALGPFLDATDGVTAETGLTISQADVRLKKNDGAWAQVNDATAASHEENGWYEKELDATDTDTVGRLIIAIHESGALPVWHEFWVLEEVIFDALFAASATGLLPANVTQISGDSAAADNLEAAADGTGYNLGGGSVVAASVTGAVGSVTGDVGGKVIGGGAGTITGLGASTSVAAMSANVVTASALAADAVTEIQSGLATAAALTTVDTVVDAIKAVTDLLPDAGALTSLATQASVDAIDNFLDTEIADILADTGTTLDDFVDDLEGRLTAALATALQAHALGVGRGVVDASSTTTAVVFKSVNGAAASATDDFYNGRHIVFTSGTLALQATSITDYDGSSVTATVSALTGAPAEDVTFIIV